MDNAINQLKAYIRDNGPIQTVRVSSAQASGAAKAYSYYGAARGEIRIAKAGHVTCVSTERAGSDRRSERLAEQDARSIAVEEGRLEWQALGALDAAAAEMVLEATGMREVAA